MSYLVLARKYRPQSFDDLVGQEHVARTLANAITGGRVAHAFLFTGVRGVGKTTSARLLAKCLNCMGEGGDRSGPTPTPCQVCPACREIAAGVDLDVQEIDGASYNGVDEVRRLQEGLAFRPARDRYKIYIVDEVHMLSNAAWNAFLKTLEEPPPHVKFIFATTEVHKVPVTILSRCQRYDFKLISAKTVAARLTEVLQRENIAADDGAIAILAREAAGSMRDAMSLLDQVIAFSGERLTEDDVARVLGVADRKVLHELAQGLVVGNAAACLDVVHRLASQGFDLGHVSKDILRHLRNLVVAKVSGAGARELLDLADEELRDVEALAAGADTDDLLRLFQGFSRSYDEVVRSGQPRAALEVALVRLARRPPLLPLDELLARLGEMERRLAGGAPPPPRAGGGGGGGGGGAGRPPAPPSARAHGADAAARILEGPFGEMREATTLPRAVAPAAPAMAPPASPSASLPTATLAPSAPPMAKPAPAPSTGTGALAVMPAAGPAATVDLAAWRRVLARIAGANPGLASIYEHAVPVEVSAARLHVGYDETSFLGGQASDAENLEVLRREARAELGPVVVVSVDLALGDGERHRTVASMDAEVRRKELAEARRAVETHPLVAEAVALFGAEIRDVKLPPREGGG